MKGMLVNTDYLRQIMLFEMGFQWAVSSTPLNRKETIYKTKIYNNSMEGIHFDIYFNSGKILHTKSLYPFDIDYLKRKAEQTGLNGYKYVCPESVVYLKRMGCKTSVMPYRLEKRQKYDINSNPLDMQLSNLALEEVIYPLPDGWETSVNLFFDYETALITDITGQNLILN